MGAEYIFHLNYCFFAEGHKLRCNSRLVVKSRNSLLSHVGKEWWGKEWCGKCCVVGEKWESTQNSSY